MGRSHKDKMPLLLRALCLSLILMALFLFLSMSTGVFALFEVEKGKLIAAFVFIQLVVAFLSIIPLLVFVRLVRAVIASKEFFSGKQSKRMMTIAVCFAVRVVFDLFAPSIEVPALLDGAIGSMSIGPSLNLTMLAVSIMFFALAGVFEYGRKLQEDSDNIL